MMNSKVLMPRFNGLASGTSRVWAAIIVLLMPAMLLAGHADIGPLNRAKTILQQANLAEERHARPLVEKALRLLNEVQPATDESRELTHVCRTYLKAADAFWQADRHKGSAEAERLLRGFNAANKNPLFLQALLFQGRHHYWKAVEGNYKQGIEISKKMFEEILRHNPSHRLARLYLGKPVEPLKPELERAPDGAPEWAVAGREAMYWTRRMVHWWIDNRQSPSGQLGGGWSDDVEFSKTWSFYCLTLNDDKVRKSLTKIADNIWHCPDVANGYFAGTSKNWHLVDVEHGAEWMSFSQPQMMLARYGDPRYIERNMQVIRNMDFLTGINTAGRRHFKAYYFSHDVLHPRRLYHCDVPENARYTKPGIYVSWYARHPKVMRWFREWGNSWVEHSLAAKPKGKPSGFIPSEIVYETNQVGGMSGKWYRIAGYPGYDFAGGSWTTKHLMGQFIANAKLFDDPRCVEPISRMVQWKTKHRDAPYGPEGSVGWILRKETHSEEMWNRWQRLRDGIEAPNTSDLVKKLRAISALHASTWEMNTQEVIATDRVPIPARPSDVLMNMYTGGSGSMQAYYPDSAVAWENVELKAVPMVLQANARSLKIMIHNFDRRKRDIKMRPLELGTGLYEVRINGKRHEDFQLAHRFEPLQLTLAPQVTSTVELRQLMARPLRNELPDLALSETECVLDSSGKSPMLIARVHNVGIRDSGPATVTFTAMTNERPKQLGVHKIKNIAWPKMLMPSYVTIKQPWNMDKRVQSIRVEVSTASPDEICVENNRIELACKDWRDPSDFLERPNLFGAVGADIPRPVWPIARRSSPPGTELPGATGFQGVSHVFGPFRDVGNLKFPVRYCQRQSLAWLVRDEENLYVLVTSWKSDTLRRKTKPGTTGPVGEFMADDRIELLFQAPGEPWRSIQVNANGVSRGKTADGQPWHPRVNSIHMVRNEAWCAEWWCRIEIPLESLSEKAVPTDQTWHFDIVRHGFEQGQPQVSSWSGGVAEKPASWGQIKW